MHHLKKVLFPVKIKFVQVNLGPLAEQLYSWVWYEAYVMVYVICVTFAIL